MNILEDLNPEQRKAVTHPGGPLLILAGAGSGKTRVLTYRTAYLIKHMGIKPESILAITFTNKAAREMKDRIEKMLPQVRGILVSTFHSACVRFLRSDIDRLGYKKNFIIFDTQDQQILMRECIKARNIDEKKYTPAGVLSYIGRAKDKLLSPQKCMEKAKDFREKTMADLYDMYQEKLLENNAMDFDDLIGNCVRLFETCPDVLARYQDKFRYILVDEYQDTNRAQYRWLRLLAEKHRNLCAVGDGDQAIYGWRGADSGNLLAFERDFPECRVITLETNYRSTATILEAANHLIRHNARRRDKSLKSVRGRGELIQVCTLESSEDEAQYVAEQVQAWVAAGGAYGDCAVLYRANAQSRAVEEAFLAAAIPYT
ncbi:MAG: UvrD-helicase domain-containing protein, partial [Alicyclobacillus sp.]|nr:UvrD-helicase domain-containing protein [Alicyclobacillus sp.]